MPGVRPDAVGSHHLRFIQPSALGHRVSDEFTVPLCRVHHRDLHRQGDEAEWWGKLSIDPVPVALKLWQHTRVNGTAISISGGTELGSAVATLASQQGPAGTTPPRGTPPAKLPTAAQTNDLVSTDRGQSKQCAQEHRSEN